MVKYLLIVEITALDPSIPTEASRAITSQNEAEGGSAGDLENNVVALDNRALLPL